MATTREIQSRLLDIREILKEMPVTTWLHEKKESPQDIADTVDLMAEVVYSLSSEIDLFSHGSDMAPDSESNDAVQDDASTTDNSEPTELEPLAEDDNG